MRLTFVLKNLRNKNAEFSTMTRLEEEFGFKRQFKLSLRRLMWRFEATACTRFMLNNGAPFRWQAVNWEYGTCESAAVAEMEAGVMFFFAVRLESCESRLFSSENPRTCSKITHF